MSEYHFPSCLRSDHGDFVAYASCVPCRHFAGIGRHSRDCSPFLVQRPPAGDCFQSTAGLRLGHCGCSDRRLRRRASVRLPATVPHPPGWGDRKYPKPHVAAHGATICQPCLDNGHPREAHWRTPPSVPCRHPASIGRLQTKARNCKLPRDSYRRMSTRCRHAAFAERLAGPGASPLAMTHPVSVCFRGA